jgi:tRNA (uracil-5-)-methyltransferase TRM9
VLDLGCGHGLLAGALAAAGHRARYMGLDSSQALLDRARQSVRHPSADFLLADLAKSDWPSALAAVGLEPVEWVFALAVLHHLPGEELRRQVAAQARTWLAAGERMVVSVWDFLASPRWTARVLPWETINLSEDQVDPEDYLLDWREGGRGLRYVHHFTPESLETLAHSAGFEVVETYRSDGEGGKLGLYQVWGAR